MIIKSLITFLSNESILFQPIFFNDLNKFNKLKTQKEETQKKKANVYDITLELYKVFLETHFDEYYDLSNGERKQWSTNINLKSFSEKHIIRICGMKMQI